MVHKGGDNGNTREEIVGRTSEGIVGTKGRTIMTGKRSLSVPLLSGPKKSVSNVVIKQHPSSSSKRIVSS